MTNKQRLLYDKAGYGPPAFYNAFAWMDGPVAWRFLQAHLELLRQMAAYLRRRD
jgi:hypothetical protein